MPTRLASFLKSPKLDLAFFCNQLSRLLSSGYTLPESLGSLESIVNRNILTPLSLSVNRGKGLSRGMKNFPKIFSSEILKLINIGEETGFLPQILDAISIQEQRKKELSGKIIKATVYPGLILTLGLLLVIYMLFFVLPSFQTIFADLNSPLPITIRALLAMPNLLGKYSLAIALTILTSGFGLRYLLKQEYWQERTSELLWNRRFSKLYWLSKCFWLVSLGLSVGIPLTTSLKQVRSIITNNAFRRQWSQLITACQQGQSFHLAATKSGLPADACALIAVMEKHGELSSGLQKVSEQYQAELENYLDKLATMLEPAAIIVTGGVIGLIIVNLISPMMQLTQQLL